MISDEDPSGSGRPVGARLTPAGGAQRDIASTASAAWRP